MESPDVNFVLCNACDNPGHLNQALDMASVPSNVRKFKDLKFTVWRCRGCGSIHSKEKVDLDFFYTHYPLQKQKQSYAYTFTFRRRLRHLIQLGLNRKSRILDMGCGTGLFVAFLKSRGYANSFGYDAYSKNFSDKTILGEKYDFIIASDVIEHVNEPRMMLLEMKSCLNQDGILVISTPNSDDINLSNYEMYSREIHQPYHRHILSEKALKALGEKTGLKFQALIRRPYFDTLAPGVNQRFIWGYARKLGNFVDVFIEDFQFTKLLFSIDLMFFFWFGYFFPVRGNMTMIFRIQKEQISQ